MPPWKLRGARACNGLFIALELHFHATARLSSRAGLLSTRTALYATQVPEPLPLRKQLKDEAKAKRTAGLKGASQPSGATQKNLEDWELTVGIEIHAQLNTARKLFSREYPGYAASPNLTTSRCCHLYQ
jgi:aspartyl-tRNA(Asn)/glutamyl-tRNA(Gln) amidotransferase subunit B